MDLYAGGEVAGDRAQSLLEDAGAFAQECGRHELQDLRAHGSAGSSRNMSRDLRRRLLKTSAWPPVYLEEIRFWSIKQKCLVLKKVAILLPHEILGAMEETGQEGVLTQSGGLDPPNRARHAAIQAKIGDFVSLSLWGDGVPQSWDRKKSVDMWTLAFPGMDLKEHRDLRICLTAMPHENVCRETQDDLMSILVWSMQNLAAGKYPATRHDAQEWGPEDTWRRRRAGQDLIKGAVLEIKGDWKQLHFCFAVPGWMSSLDSPICWRCHATKRSLVSAPGDEQNFLAPDMRLSHPEALQRIVQEGGTLSPVWGMPWLTMDALRIDWLHVADQGISPVFLGGLFHLILEDRLLGANVEARCNWLWRQIQTYYVDNAVTDRLFNLVPTMIKPKKGSIELAGSAAQIRHLIPFGLQLVNSWGPDAMDQERLIVRVCMRHLKRCYDFLSNTVEGHDSLLQNALAYCHNLQGLHAIDPKRWQMRPKLHLFLELAAEPGTPSSSWNYREESFGGSVSRQSHRRGGIASPLALSRATLTKFCAKEALPRFV